LNGEQAREIRLLKPIGGGAAVQAGARCSQQQERWSGAPTIGAGPQCWMIKRHNVANVPPARLSSAALTAPVCLTSEGLVRVVAGPDWGPRRRGQLRNPVGCAHTVRIRCSARPLRQCRKTVRHACCASRSWTPHPLCAPVSTVSGISAPIQPVGIDGNPARISAPDTRRHICAGCRSWPIRALWGEPSSAADGARFVANWVPPQRPRVFAALCVRNAGEGAHSRGCITPNATVPSAPTLPRRRAHPALPRTLERGGRAVGGQRVSLIAQQQFRNPASIDVMAPRVGDRLPLDMTLMRLEKGAPVVRPWGRLRFCCFPSGTCLIHFFFFLSSCWTHRVLPAGRI